MRKMIDLEFEGYFDLVYIYSIQIINTISQDNCTYINSYVSKLFNTKQKICY